MNWPAAMLCATTILYAAASVGYLHVHRPAMCLVFVGYAIANVGLILDVMA